jgi:GNAT superfamily N-acetyltransferase
VLTDRARVAWLSDVFVVDEYRGHGLGKWLVETIMADPRLSPVGRWLLATRDAHDLYRRFGWEDAPADRYMVFTPKSPA